jgi:vancomycin aglycone glucosyltransferase
VRTQFPVIAEAARGCDLVVGATALQFATRSIAESLGIPYVFAAYCPAVFPSPDHPPPKIPEHHPQGLPAKENLALWASEDERWNDLFRVAINEGRAGLGLAPIDDVRSHLFTDTPLLAADPVLGPPGATLRGVQIRQTGAWLYSDSSALPEALERFLGDGEPPVYLGFGSMRAADNTGPMLIEAARALGLRSLISRGWGNLAALDGASDTIAIEDVSHEKLFPRVAAVVHHGGAGTTARAARAGAAQVIVPHNYDQYYWGHRVQQLGIGASGVDREHLTVDALVGALSEALHPDMKARALALADRIRPDGARLAAKALSDLFHQPPGD